MDNESHSGRPKETRISRRRWRRRRQLKAAALHNIHYIRST